MTWTYQMDEAKERKRVSSSDQLNHCTHCIFNAPPSPLANCSCRLVVHFQKRKRRKWQRHWRVWRSSQLILWATSCLVLFIRWNIKFLFRLFKPGIKPWLFLLLGLLIQIDRYKGHQLFLYLQSSSAFFYTLEAGSDNHLAIFLT